MKGGTSLVHIDLPEPERGAAMEPPGEGRYEQDPRLDKRVALVAAMEPPGEGRYEFGGGLQTSPKRGIAAMEPPGEGRYELLGGLRSALDGVPQWSRPVKGGTSRPAPGGVRGDIPPQWSRPVKGGTSFGPPDAGGATILAAMEPPGEGRYELLDRDRRPAFAWPQWSRPVKGGTRRCLPARPVRGEQGAAMEPPGEGRYEWMSGTSGPRCVGRRNGAAR